MNSKTVFAGIFALIFFGTTVLSAQEVISPLSGNAHAEAWAKKKRPAYKALNSDTLDLPFFEDFSNSFIEPDEKRWSDRYAYVNNDYPVNVISNGVASLDALDATGSIYAGATIDPKTFSADTLSSRPIDLNLLPSDSVYLSFFYQPRGLGDEPEAQDSLILEFYAPEDSLWLAVWKIPGAELSDFRQVMIPVHEEGFLKKGFRFRFRNLASLPANSDYPDKRGNVDHWHLDYIKLDRDRFAGDTVLRDVAFSSKISSFLKDLHSLPWSHLEAAWDNVLNPLVPVRYRNNDSIIRNQTRSVLIEDLLWDESYIPIEPTAQDLPAGMDTAVSFTLVYPLLDFSRGDSALFRLTATLHTDEFDPKVNDTVYRDFLFRDYYAYDDGSAEAGYGLRGQGTQNGSVALSFHAYEPDLIGGVEISFNQLLDSLNMGYFFKFIVWSDNGGVPGSIIFEDGEDHQPAYPSTHPGFVRYYFTEPVAVDGDFFVGWRQYNKYMLNVGLDLNNRPDPHVMFYNFQGDWVASEAPGVPLIRPFLYDPLMSVEAASPTYESLHIYPNPARDILHFESASSMPENAVAVRIYDMSGRLVLQEYTTAKEIKVSSLGEGMYSMEVRDDHLIRRAKLLIRK